MRARGPSDPIDTFRETVVSLVRSENPDLTARQLSVFLICYTTRGPHTVRGLARQLNVQKPAVVRAIDRLETFSLAKRRPDLQDRRSIFIEPTEVGQGYLRQIRRALGGKGVRESEPAAPEPDMRAFETTL